MICHRGSECRAPSSLSLRERADFGELSRAGVRGRPNQECVNTETRCRAGYCVPFLRVLHEWNGTQGLGDDRVGTDLGGRARAVS